MSAPIRPFLVRGAAVAAVAAVAGLWSAGSAFALGAVDVSPKSVVPGGTVTVEGTCPEPVRSAYVRATVGIDAIGRYVVVPVEDGAFQAKFRARGVGGFDDPVPGDKLRAQVSCATDSSFVVTVGTVKVKVVEDALGVDAASSTNSAAPKAAAAGVSTDEDSPIEPWVPITAFAVAALGTVGAYALSRRTDRRTAAMNGHPAQRGVGLPPRRDAK